jgi:hypothetical protein
MRSRGRTGPAVTRIAKIVCALNAAPCHCRARRNTFGQRRRRRGKVEEHPMDPGLARRIRVLDQQDKGSCPLGRVAPGQRRRKVLSVAGVGARDRRTIFESAALQNELCHRSCDLSSSSEVRIPRVARDDRSRDIARAIISWRASPGEHPCLATGAFSLPSPPVPVSGWRPRQPPAGRPRSPLPPFRPALSRPPELLPHPPSQEILARHACERSAPSRRGALSIRRPGHSRGRGARRLPDGRRHAPRERERARDQARGRAPLGEPRAGAPAGADPE